MCDRWLRKNVCCSRQNGFVWRIGFVQSVGFVWDFAVGLGALVVAVLEEEADEEDEALDALLVEVVEAAAGVESALAAFL